MPDLKAQELENKDKKKKQQRIIAEFSYDNSLEETDDAMKTFQQKFSSKKGRLSIVAYSLMAAAAVAAIVFNPAQVVLYLALAFCVFGLVYTLTDKKRMRKKVIETIKKMNPEDYHCTIFDNRIEIETVIKPNPEEPKIDSEENIHVELDAKADENTEEAVDVAEEPIKSVFKFGEDMLDFVENDRSMLLILARRQIYCFPKRCLTEEQQTAIRDFLPKKLETFM